MQVDDCDRKPAESPPIPASGRFVNRAPLPLSERVYRLLERVRFVVPVAREGPQRGGRSSHATASYLSPSTK